jgi:hypothetical protein
MNVLPVSTDPGSLFAAPASERSREVALRLPFGLSRIRIVRQLLAEAGLIFLAGESEVVKGRYRYAREVDTESCGNLRRRISLSKSRVALHRGQGIAWGVKSTNNRQPRHAEGQQLNP